MTSDEPPSATPADRFDDVAAPITMLRGDGKPGWHRSEGGGAAVVVLLIVLLILYVLSIGPFAALSSRGYINADENSWIVYVYFPLLWVANQVGFVGTALKWYIFLWIDT